MPSVPATGAKPRLKTALITGASSGIGAALARRFAAGGHDVVLCARDEGRLKALAGDLEDRCGVRAAVIVADLAAPEAVDGVMRALAAKDLTVDVLVNNAGFGVHGTFLGTDLASELRMVDVQIGALLRLTKLLVPPMIARGFGGVLNVASVYSFSPVAFQAVYGGCKSFLYSFSEALANETAGTGLSITLLCPGSTKTEFRMRAGVKEKKPGGKGMSAEVVADAGYQGLLRGKRIVVPGMHNRLFVAIARHAPATTVAAFLRVINRFRGMAGKGG